jgi:site-specific recombinase XerD
VIPANRGKKLPAEPLTQNEVKALLTSCSKRAPTGIRNRALIATLYRAGLRISEALALRPKDLDQEAGTLRILHTKNNRARVVGLDASAWLFLQAWLDQRTALGIDANAPVFCTLKGTALKTAYVRKLMPRLAKKAGILKRVHAHGLRHTFAFELANEGVALHLVQAQLGHANLSITDRYIRHLNPTAVVEAMRSRSWSL